MRGDILKLLDYERKRRPELDRVAQRIADYSAADIDRLELPLPWMRDALHRLRAGLDLDQMRLFVEQHVVDGHAPDPIGIMCEWGRGDEYIKVGRTALLVSCGQLLWVGHDGLWIDTVHTREIDPKLRGGLIQKARVTRSAYNAAVRERARSVLPSPSGNTHHTQTENSGVRFFRPG